MLDEFEIIFDIPRLIVTERSITHSKQGSDYLQHLSLGVPHDLHNSPLSGVFHGISYLTENEDRTLRHGIALSDIGPWMEVPSEAAASACHGCNI